MKNILLIFMSLIIVSCTKSDDSIGLIFNQESYDTNRELWENSGIKDYRFIQSYSSLSVGGLPNLITVVKDSKLDTIYAQSNDFHDYPIEDYPPYKTIDDVFDVINSIAEIYKKEISSSDSSMEGAKIEVEYDEKYYYPTKINFSGYYKQSLNGGSKGRIIISDFKVN